MFKKQVVVYEKGVKKKVESHKGLYDLAIERIDIVPVVFDKYYLCKRCKKSLDKGEVPPMSHRNNLETDYVGRKIDIKDDDGNIIEQYILTEEDVENLTLTDLEQSLIARSLIFLKIHKLPKSRMGNVSSKIVYVPINENDTLNTIDKVLRTPSEAGILSVKVKRKMEYKQSYQEEFINLPKVIKALRLLAKVRHPEYKFLSKEQIDDYEKRCNEEVFDDIEEDFKKDCYYTDSDNLYLFGNLFCEDELVPSDSVQDEIKVPDETVIEDSNNSPVLAVREISDDKDQDEEDLREYLTKDAVAKQQFEYDRSTCLTNDVPEAEIGVSVSVAPAEGKVPINILMAPRWDRRTFSTLDVTGQSSLNVTRTLAPGELRSQDYFDQRLTNFNEKVSKSPAYFFSATQFTESKQLQGNMSIAFKKGKKTEAEDGGVSYKLDDPWRVLDDIKGTPRFFQKKKMEFISKLENLGPFTIFFTLSCADRKWSENFTSLLNMEGHKVVYGLNDNFEEVTVDGIPLKDFLNQNEGQHEFIRKNILNATRVFDDRIKEFIKHIIMSKISSIPASFYNYRIEFQVRPD